MLKKRVAAFVLALGLLGGCTPAQQGNTEGSGPLISEPVSQGESQKAEMTVLSEYVSKGTTIVDAAEKDAFDGSVVPVSVGNSYAAADSSGIPVTDTIYDRVKALPTEEKTIWIFYRGEEQTCISDQGVVLLERTGGTISLCGETYLVWKAEDGTSEVFALDGTLLAALDGKVKSCDGGILVSKGQDVWYLTDTKTWVTKEVSGVENVTPFYKGCATVQISKKSWGLIDEEGSITVLSDISWMDRVRGNYILAKNESEAYGVVTTEGKEAVPFSYVDAQACSEDVPIYQLWTEDGNCSVRNVKTDQTIRLPDSFDGEALTIWPDNYFSFTQDDGTIVLFDDLGTIELDVGTELTMHHSEDVLVACDGETVTLISLNDGTMTKKQDGIYVKNKGMSKGQTDYLTVSDPETGLQGIWDTNGREILPMEYDQICATGNGLFAAKQGDGCGLVNSKGKWTVYMAEA